MNSTTQKRNLFKPSTAAEQVIQHLTHMFLSYHNSLKFLLTDKKQCHAPTVWKRQ